MRLLTLLIIMTWYLAFNSTYANQQSADEQFELGDSCVKSEDYQQAAVRGDSKAQYNLGVMYG